MKNRSTYIYEEGFTILESIVAIFILSLGSVALCIGGSTFFSHITELRSHYLFLSQAAQFDALLREEVALVEIPFWEHSVALEPEGKACTLPFLKGNKESCLQICFDSKGLCVSLDSDTPVIYTALRNGTITPIVKEDITTGITVLLYDTKKTVYECKALFGGLPITDEEADE
jgi:(2Fe-2S) ferredoxin